MPDSDDFAVIWDFLKAQGITLPDSVVTITFPDGDSHEVEVPTDLVGEPTE